MERLEVLFRIRDDKRQEFLQTFLVVIGSPVPGQQLNGLYEDVAQRGQFLWIERWADPVAFERRTRSDEFQVAVGAIGVLGGPAAIRAGRVFVEPDAGVSWPSLDALCTENKEES